MFFRLLSLLLFTFLTGMTLAQPDSGDSKVGVLERYETPVSPFYLPRDLVLRDTPQMSGEERASTVRRRIDRVVRKHGSDPQTAYVESHLGPVVVRTQEEVLATVLDQDLPDFYQQLKKPEDQLDTKLEVAEQWRRLVQAELNQGAFLHSHAYARLAFWVRILVLLAAVVIHLAIRRVAGRYIHSPLWALIALNWLVCLTAVLWLQPSVRSSGLALSEHLLKPYIWLAVVVLGAWIFHSIAMVVIHRYLRAVVTHRRRVDQRIDQRVAILTQAVSGALKTAVFVLAGLAYLAPFDIDWTPIATGAGVLGVTLSLAAQDLMRDVVAGSNILMEDQFGLGDWVESGPYCGEVERFTLRATHLRTMNGSLVTIPNSMLRPAANLSKEWARVDFQVQISYQDDLDKALAVFSEELQTLSDEYKDQCPDKPEILGVDKLSADGIALRALLKTRPLGQWEVKRELNRRIKIRFDKEGISIPFPQREIWIHTKDGS